MGRILDIIYVPFGMLMKFFYDATGNYAVTLLLFTVAVQIVLIPFGVKQQRSQMRMAQIRPKEQIIRAKYKGRTDAATNQKMQQEVLNMYKQENYSPMSGCLPMLVQLPIIIALYGIVRHPLTYIAGISAELMDRIKLFLAESSEFLPNFSDVRSIQEIDVVKVIIESFDKIKGSIDFTGIPAEQLGLLEKYKDMNFNFFGQSLLTAPSENFLSVLMLIPVLNFAVVFLQTRLTSKLQANSTLGDAANNKSMKIMQYTMPLMIVYFCYIMSSALGLYWIYRSIAAILQTLILAKLMPVPAVTDEDLKRAQEQYGGAVKKKKKRKKPAELISGDEEEESEPENILEKNSEKPEKNLKKAKENQKRADIYIEDDESPGESGADDTSGWDDFIKQRESEGDKKGGEETGENGKKKDEPLKADAAPKKNHQKTGKKYAVKRRNGGK